MTPISKRIVREEAGQAPEAVRERATSSCSSGSTPGASSAFACRSMSCCARWAAQLRPERPHRAWTPTASLELMNLHAADAAVRQPSSIPPSRLSSRRSCSAAPQGAATAVRSEPMRPGVRRRCSIASAHGIYPVRDGALQFDRVHRRLSGRHVQRVHDLQRPARFPQYPTARTARAHHPSAHAHGRSRPDRSVLQLLPVAAVHARRRSPAQRHPHALLDDEDRPNTSFLPPAWRTVTTSSRDGEPYEYLWLLVARADVARLHASRTPATSPELRQLLPAETRSASTRSICYYNTSILYDVFDIDGDFEPEVMGVRYFIAYSLKDGRPGSAARARRAPRLLRLAVRRRAAVRRGRPGVSSATSSDGRFIERRAPWTARSTTASSCAKPTTNRRRSSSTASSTSRLPKSCARSVCTTRFPGLVTGWCSASVRALWRRRSVGAGVEVVRRDIDVATPLRRRRSGALHKDGRSDRLSHFAWTVAGFTMRAGSARWLTGSGSLARRALIAGARRRSDADRERAGELVLAGFLARDERGDARRSSGRRCRT